jgi:hypothetical protein
MPHSQQSIIDYLAKRGIETRSVDMTEHDRAMRERVIPAIERDLKAQRRAAHFARLGIPDPDRRK